MSVSNFFAVTSLDGQLVHVNKQKWWWFMFSVVLRFCLSKYFVPMMFAFVALPAGLLLALIVPCGQNADEPAHALRADSLSRGELLGHLEIQSWDGRPFARAGVDADTAIVLVTAVLPWGGLPKAQPTTLSLAEHVGWDKVSFIEIGSIASYFPVAYVPAAIALKISRLVDLSPYDAFIVARLFNVFIFGAVGFTALLISRRGRVLLLAVLTMPMTVSLSASVSGDALLISGSVLAIALLTRASALADFQTQGPALISRQCCWVIAAWIICLISLVKAPYIALVALLLLPIPRLQDWRRSLVDLLRRISLVVAIFGIWAIWMFWVAHHLGAPVGREPYEAGPLWPGPRPARFDSTDINAQLHVLWSHPTWFVTLPLMSFLDDPWIVRQTVGVLGWLNVVLPDWIYTAWYGILGLSTFSCLMEVGHRSRGRDLIDFFVVLISISACFLLVYLTLFLYWTNVGSSRIGGVQGRYFLPLLPVLAAGIPRLSVPFGHLLLFIMSCSVGLMGLTTMFATLVAVVQFYYLH